MLRIVECPLKVCFDTTWRRKGYIDKQRECEENGITCTTKNSDTKVWKGERQFSERVRDEYSKVRLLS